MEVTLYSEAFTLDSSGSLFDRKTETLYIADVHLGKVSHFRKHGSAVPVAVVEENFRKLDTVVSKFQPKIICFLGDLFHSDFNKEWLFFEAWIQKNSAIQFQLIIGNHDIIDPYKFEQLGIELLKESTKGNFYFTHEPSLKRNHLNICGHIHPAVQLKGRGKQFVKLSCFYKTKDQFILPAFGGFTGNFILDLEEAEAVYGIAEQEIIQLK